MTAFDKAWGIAKEDDDDCECITTDMSGKCTHCLRTPEEQAKRDGRAVDKADFGEKFNSKLDSLKEGGRPVPKRFADMKSTTDGEDHNRKVMANILETDNDGIEDEYEKLKDMFDNEPSEAGMRSARIGNGSASFDDMMADRFGHQKMPGPSIPDNTSQALGSKGLIDRFRRAGRTP